MESNSNPVQPVLRATRAEQLRMQCKMRWSTIRLPLGATGLSVYTIRPVACSDRTARIHA
jgi:hypothetical protein